MGFLSVHFWFKMGVERGFWDLMKLVHNKKLLMDGLVRKKFY